MPSNDQLAKALIAAWRVADVFDPSSNKDAVEVVHRQSGMLCLFGPLDMDTSTLRVYPGKLPRGDDVSCGTTTEGISMTIYAARYPEGPSAETALRSMVESMRDKLGQLSPSNGAGKSLRDPRLPMPVKATFLVDSGGKAQFEKASAVRVGAWTIMERTTSDADKAEAADLTSDATLMIAMSTMPDAKAAPKP